MKYPTRFILAILLGCSSLPAAPSAHEDLARTMLQGVKLKEFLYAGSDKMVDRLKTRGLPPTGQEELRAALNKFMDDLVADGIFVKPLADSFRDKLSEEEALTFVAFLQSSAGKKLLNGSIRLGSDKERAQQAISDAMQSRTGELAVIVTKIAEKYQISIK